MCGSKPYSSRGKLTHSSDPPHSCKAAWMVASTLAVPSRRLHRWLDIITVGDITTIYIYLFIYFTKNMCYSVTIHVIHQKNLELELYLHDLACLMPARCNANLACALHQKLCDEVLQELDGWWLGLARALGEHQSVNQARPHHGRFPLCPILMIARIGLWVCDHMDWVETCWMLACWNNKWNLIICHKQCPIG